MNTVTGMKVYAPTLHDLAGKALLNSFHDEYRNLNESDSFLVRVDFLDAEIPSIKASE